MKNLVLGGIAVLSLAFAMAATSTPVSAASCTDFKGFCTSHYRGSDPGACQKAALSCSKTCKFVGPGTGTVYVADTGGKCSPKRASNQ